MSTAVKHNKPVDRAPPSKLDLPNLFREIANSLRRSFRAARGSIARRSQGAYSIFDALFRRTAQCRVTADGSRR
jgi:hypothetical protein